MKLHSSILCCWMVGTASAFVPRSHSSVSPTFKQTKESWARTSPVSTTSLYWFGNKNNQEEEASSEADNETKDNKKAESEQQEEKVPFFSRFMNPKQETKDPEANGKSEVAKEAPTSVVSNNDPSPTSASRGRATQQKQQQDELDPIARAKALKAQAERTRLEAERMDAKLTLEKIGKLEKELVTAKNKGNSVEDLQRQLDNLQAKLRGEQPKPIIIPKPDTKSKSSDSSSSSTTTTTAAITTTTSKSTDMLQELTSIADLEDVTTTLELLPGFLQKPIAVMLEMDVSDGINETELALRLFNAANGDFSYSSKPKPSFTEFEIEEMKRAIELEQVMLPDNLVKLAGGNATQLAISALEFDHYIDMDEDVVQKAYGDDEWMAPLLKAVNQSMTDNLLYSLYPECTRKEDVAEPTEAQVKMLVSDVLPKAKFKTNAPPQKVAGGYIIKGSHNYKNGDELIEAVDKSLSKSNLADKMTVLYANDYTSIAEMEYEQIFTTDDIDSDPVLYILGPDIVRERKPVLLSLATAMGFATSWYLSIYPFLLNPTLAQRIEEQLSVADAGMQYDLDWLTDLSLPLFVSFLLIQAAHEIAHRVVAALYGMKVSAPTLVPSLITGITSSVTTFKSPPKNRDAMIDFSLAGPIVGMLASAAAVFVGSQLTLVRDPATLPALPLEILRQSTVGGGIIDSVIQGSLYVPDGAPMSGIMISLHPIAIAGYISLVVNALAMLPVGTTDGGRVLLGLVGREGKGALGVITLIALLVSGLLGSDLFLFYFAFVLAFQTGNEIPARNEVDDPSFLRIFTSILGLSMAFYSLVPF